MLHKKIHIQNQEIDVFMPETESNQMGVFYTFPDNTNEATQLAHMLPENTALVAIYETNWEQYFTPWAAPRLFKKGTDFAGGGADYYARLCDDWIGKIEQECGIQAAWRGILGYSLAGLLAVYGATIAPRFDYVASVSGSLWFDNWLNFMRENTPRTLPRAIYFSLGDTESQTKNERMAQVQTATEQTFAHWQQLGCPTILQMNAGGHFDQVPQRLAKAANWLVQAA